MAKRPIFLPSDQSTAFVRELVVEFEWFPGLSIQQRRRSLAALHSAAQERHGVAPMLEVSTKSSERLGRDLSAFALQARLPSGTVTSVESAFQGSKVFEFGGPYPDLYRATARDAKRDPRLRSSGKVVGFRLEDQEWPTEPVHAFYEWIYLNALRDSGIKSAALDVYEGFTDIEFNPAKSWNCQARAVARYLGLLKSDLEVPPERSSFVALLTRPAGPLQPRLE